MDKITIEELNALITKYQEQREYYDKKSQGGMCIILTGKIEAINEVKSIIQRKQ